MSLAVRAMLDGRASERFSVEIPATLHVRSQDYTAKMLNLVRSGAMVESSAPLETDSLVALRCGTVIVGATVVWSDSGRAGLKFATPLTDCQVSEQVARSLALSAYRNARSSHKADRPAARDLLISHLPGSCSRNESAIVQLYGPKL
jgi:hypothetical protein